MLHLFYCTLFSSFMSPRTNDRFIRFLLHFISLVAQHVSCSFVEHNAITWCGLNETDMTEDQYVCVDRRGRKAEMKATLSDPHTPVSRHLRTTDKARLSSYLSIYLPQFVCFSSPPSVHLLQQQTESNNNNDSRLVAGEDPPGCDRERARWPVFDPHRACLSNWVEKTNPPPPTRLSWISKYLWGSISIWASEAHVRRWPWWVKVSGMHEDAVNVALITLGLKPDCLFWH